MHLPVSLGRSYLDGTALAGCRDACGELNGFFQGFGFEFEITSDRPARLPHVGPGGRHGRSIADANGNGIFKKAKR
jgi:hypothetical protein